MKNKIIATILIDAFRNASEDMDMVDANNLVLNALMLSDYERLVLGGGVKVDKTESLNMFITTPELQVLHGLKVYSKRTAVSRLNKYIKSL